MIWMEERFYWIWWGNSGHKMVKLWSNDRQAMVKK